MTASSPRADADQVKGAQSIRRAIAVLREVASSGVEGARSADIASTLGLTSATTHRIISTLVDEAMIERDDATKQYRVGPEIVALGASFDRRLQIRDRLGPVLRAVAKGTEDSVFLQLRSGAYSICIAREEGTFPIRAQPLEIGTRRPLGVGAGPLGILAFLEQDEREKLVTVGESRFKRYGLQTSDVRNMVERSIELGYAFNDGRIIPEMSAVALPVRTTESRIVGAISVAAINSRMGESRRGEIVALLKHEIEAATPLRD